MSAQDEAVTLAARALMGPVLDLLEADPHSFSERPCSTCLAVSSISGRPFGCTLMAQLGHDKFRSMMRGKH